MIFDCKVTGFVLTDQENQFTNNLHFHLFQINNLQKVYKSCPQLITALILGKNNSNRKNRWFFRFETNAVNKVSL